MKVVGKDPAQLIGKVLWEEFPEVPNEETLRRVMSERVALTDEPYDPPLGECVENHMYPSHDGGQVVFQRYLTKRKRMEEDHRRHQLQDKGPDQPLTFTSRPSISLPQAIGARTFTPPRTEFQTASFPPLSRRRSHDLTHLQNL